MIKRRYLMLIVSLMVLSIMPYVFSTESWSYNYLDTGDTIQSGANYSINVNNTNFFDSYSVLGLRALYKTYYDTIYYSISNPQSFINKSLADTYYYSKADINTNLSNLNSTTINTQNISVSNSLKVNHTAIEKIYDFNLFSPANTFGYKVKYKQNATLSQVNAVAPTSWGGTEFAGYSEIWTADGNFIQNNNAFGGGTYLGHLYEFKTSDTNNTVDFINVTWVGTQTARTYAIYMWNFTSSAWYKVSPTLSGTTSATYTYKITDGKNFINNTGSAYILLSSLSTGTPWFVLLTDYISLNVTSKTGQTTFSNNNFDNQIKITSSSPNALSVIGTDGSVLLNVDGNKKSVTMGGLSSSGNVIGAENMWVKGKLGLGSGGEPTTDVFNIYEEYIDGTQYPTEIYQSMCPSTYYPDNLYNAGIWNKFNPDFSCNYSDGSLEISLMTSPWSGFVGHNTGNTNTSLVGIWTSAIDNVGFLSSGVVKAKDGYGIYIEPVRTFGVEYTNFTGNIFGMYVSDIIVQDWVYANKNYGLFLEKPTLAGATGGNYQFVLNGTSTGSGIWFGGTSGQRLYSNNSKLNLAGSLDVVGNLTISTGYTGTCVNTTYISGIAVRCND
jgi:hypothetical protein